MIKKMKVLQLLIVILGFSLSSVAQIPGPKFVFFGDNPDRCDGKVDLTIGLCTATVSGSFAVDNVVWNFGDATSITTNTLSISHSYAASGDYTVTATVNGTYNGNPSVSTAISTSVGGVVTVETLCASTATSTPNLLVSANVFGMSLIQSFPAPPTTLYNTDIVVVNKAYTGSLNSTNPYYSIFLDGSIVVGPTNASMPIPLYTCPTLYYGQHIVELMVEDDKASCTYHATLPIEIDTLLTTDECSTCFTFRPQGSERYWFSAWVKADLTTAVKTYVGMSMYAEITYNGSAQSVKLYPSGEIIDGWQRIAGEFTVPSPTPADIKVNLVNSNATYGAYFDDVRIHPFNASMKSYVNDASTFWLVAELDDNNYATFYEYDKEGKLIRIKKETERGIMTIQESRMSNPKAN